MLGVGAVRAMRFSCRAHLREPGANAMDMERCYFNSSPVTASFMKNVSVHRLNGMFRNKYEIYAVYPKRADIAKIQGPNLARFTRNHDASRATCTSLKL